MADRRSTNGGTAAHGRPRIAAKTLAETRRLYEAGNLTLVEIGRKVALHPGSIRRMAKRDGWLRLPPDRTKLVGAIRKKVEDEIASVEAVLGEGLDGDAAGRARTLASLVRTLRELAKYDEDRRRGEGPAGLGAAREADADDALADPERFRQELADRLERLRHEREG